jgi:hypothetical protein
VIVGCYGSLINLKETVEIVNLELWCGSMTWNMNEWYF